MDGAVLLLQCQGTGGVRTTEFNADITRIRGGGGGGDNISGPDAAPVIATGNSRSQK
jgi:hypothetical protein